MTRNIISTAPKNCPSKHCIIHIALIFGHLFYQWPFLTQTQPFLIIKWSFLTQKHEQKLLKIFSSNHCIIYFALIVDNLFYQWPFLTQKQSFLTQKQSFLTQKREQIFIKWLYLNGIEKLSEENQYHPLCSLFTM